MGNSLTRFGKSYAAPQWKFYLGGTVALIVTNIIVLEIPQLAKQIINALAINAGLEVFTKTAIAIICLGLAQVLIRSTSRMLIFWPGRTLEAAIKADVFAHILSAPLGHLANFSIGDLTSRLNNDVTQLRIFYAFGVLQVLNVVCISIFTVTKMASIDPILTSLAISPMLVMLLLTKLVMPKLYKAMRENTEALGRLTGRVAEAFSQVHVIQTMNAVDTMGARLAPDNIEIFNSNIRTIWLRTLIWPVMTILIGISQFATLTWGGSQIINGALSVGDIMAFNIYISMLTFPFASLGIILNVYQRAKPASERLESVTALPTEADQTRKADTIAHPTEFLLEVKNVSFAWPDGRPALSDISFTVQPGERVGIFGTIGSGKSTLFNLITRLHPFNEGKILIKGQDIATMDPAVVRSTVAYGLQQPLLFSESVRSNLCLGLDESQVQIETLERATKQAQVYDDIMRLPDTWESLIGEKGIKLSGGQKQRLALARLLMRQSQLIILDDVLSAVDHDTEHRLIESLLKTKSALVIASHRVSILEPCDKVLVMQNGKVIAQGPFSKIRSIIDFADTPPHSRGDS